MSTAYSSSSVGQLQKESRSGRRVSRKRLVRPSSLSLASITAELPQQSTSTRLSHQQTHLGRLVASSRNEAMACLGDSSVSLSRQVLLDFRTTLLALRCHSHESTCLATAPFPPSLLLAMTLVSRSCRTGASRFRRFVNSRSCFTFVRLARLLLSDLPPFRPTIVLPASSLVPLY